MQTNNGLHIVPSFGDFLQGAPGSSESHKSLSGSGSLARSRPVNVPSGRVNSLVCPLALSLSQPPARDYLRSSVEGSGSLHLNLVGTPTSDRSFGTSTSSLSFPIQAEPQPLGTFFQETPDSSPQGDLRARVNLGSSAFALTQGTPAQRTEPSTAKPVSLLSRSLKEASGFVAASSPSESQVEMLRNRGVTLGSEKEANVFLQSKAYWVPNSAGGIRFDEAGQQRQAARWEVCLGEIQTALSISDFLMDELAVILDSGFFETRIAGQEAKQEMRYGVLNSVVNDFKADLAGSSNMADVGRALLNVVNSRLQH